MHPFPQPRRRFLQSVAFGAAAFSMPGVFAEELTRTPRQTEGPFYPDHLPLDTDNDLLVINDSVTPAVGEVTHLSGRVLDANGDPVRNALVEIWQCDANGVYLHSDSGDPEARDEHFQGFGRFLTSSSGEYYFRTIKPVPYFPRTPHIHFIVEKGDRRLLTTQCYVKGEPLNESDFIYNALGGAEQRAAVTVAFQPIPDSEIGELAAEFDIVLGRTPEDPEEAS